MLAVFTVSVGFGVTSPLLPFLIERLLESGGDAAQVSRATGLVTGLYTRWLAVVVKPRVHRHEAGGALNGAKIVFSCRTGVISTLELWLHPESNRSAIQKS